jgi:hypothetical protein
MKFQIEVEINRSVTEVVDIFDNADNVKQWLRGLVSSELISGSLGQPGAKSKVVFVSGGTKLELTETIRVKNLPEEYAITYEGVGYISWSRNQFFELSENRTKLLASQEIQFHGMLKLAGPLIAGTVNMRSFKEFAEKY